MGKLPRTQEAREEEAKDYCRYCRSYILDKSSIGTVPSLNKIGGSTGSKGSLHCTGSDQG